MYENTYIQNAGGMIGQYGGNEISEPPIYYFDGNEEATVEQIFGDKNAKVYTII